MYPDYEDEDESEDVVKSTGENIYPKEMNCQACRETSILKNLMIYKFIECYEVDQMKVYEVLYHSTTGEA